MQEEERTRFVAAHLARRKEKASTRLHPAEAPTAIVSEALRKAGLATSTPDITNRCASIIERVNATDRNDVDIRVTIQITKGKKECAHRENICVAGTIRKTATG